MATRQPITGTTTGTATARTPPPRTGAPTGGTAVPRNSADPNNPVQTSPDDRQSILDWMTWEAKNNPNYKVAHGYHVDENGNVVHDEPNFLLRNPWLFPLAGIGGGLALSALGVGAGGAAGAEGSALGGNATGGFVGANLPGELESLPSLSSVYGPSTGASMAATEAAMNAAPPASLAAEAPVPTIAPSLATTLGPDEYLPETAPNYGGTFSNPATTTNPNSIMSGLQSSKNFWMPVAASAASGALQGLFAPRQQRAPFANTDQIAAELGSIFPDLYSTLKSRLVDTPVTLPDAVVPNAPSPITKGGVTVGLQTPTPANLQVPPTPHWQSPNASPTMPGSVGGATRTQPVVLSQTPRRQAFTGEAPPSNGYSPLLGIGLPQEGSGGGQDLGFRPTGQNPMAAVRLLQAIA